MSSSQVDKLQPLTLSNLSLSLAHQWQTSITFVADNTQLKSVKKSLCDKEKPYLYSFLS